MLSGRTIFKTILVVMVCSLVVVDFCNEYQAHKRIQKDISVLEAEDFAISVKCWMWFFILATVYIECDISACSLAFGLPLAIFGIVAIVMQIRIHGISACYCPQYTENPGIALEKLRLIALIGVYFSVDPSVIQSLAMAVPILAQFALMLMKMQ